MSLISRWALLATLSAGLALGPRPAPAATGEVVVVTLANGEQHEGVVLAETDQDLVLELSEAGGTIIHSRSFARTNITTVAPLTPEELRQREVAAAYAVVQRYQLHPLTSYQVTYYDQVIENAFRPFLERYPDTPEAAAVAEQLAAWQVERQRVDGGQARYQGQWLPAAEVARLIAETQSQRLLSLARSHLDQRRFEQALRSLAPLETTEARALRAEICRRWIENLDTEQHALQAQLAAEQSRLQKAQQAVAAAQRIAGGSTTLRATRSDGRLGSAQKPMADLIAAQHEAGQAASLVAETQRRLAALESSRRLVVAQARMAGVTVAAEPGAVAGAGAVETPAAKEDYSSPSVLGATAEFGRKYWPVGLLVALVLVLIISRSFGR